MTTIYSLRYSFPSLLPVCCSMSGSNCCFLTCIQVSQEAGKVVWYSHLLKDFPQIVVIHTVKGFGIVNKAEKVKIKVVQLCLSATPWTIQSMKFSRSGYWSG